MKKLINKTIILSLFVALTGCNDWLDVSPKADMKAEDLFGTEAGFRDALVGVYALMCGTNSYGRDLTYGYLDVLAQYYNSPLKTTSSGYEHNFKNAAEYKYTEKTEESRISSIWSNHFSAVANINQAMLFIDENKGVFTSPEVHDVYKGEFLALRAFLHFDILRLFAPSAAMNNNKGLDALAIPYVDVFTNIAQSQLTVKEVLKKIETDLLAAKQLMKGKEEFKFSDTSDPLYNRKQRMNYYAVKALEARVLQYIGDYKNAAIAAKVVTDQIGEKGKVFSWTNVTTVLANMDYSFFNEVVFGINNPDMLSNYNSFYNKTDINDLYAVDRDNLVQNIYSGFGDNLKAIIDVRARQWTESNDQGGSSVSYSQNGTYISNKFNISANSNLPALVDFQPLIRVTEMYYIQAEAALKDGDKKTAAELLNTVSSHRGIPETSFYYLTENDMDEQFYSHIESEYYKEFYGEGQVYFYHKRMKSDQMFPGYGGTSVAVNASAMYNIPIPNIETDI